MGLTELDQALIGALSGGKGDPAAMDSLVATLAPVIQARVARFLMRSKCHSGGRNVRQELEDLTQEVFTSLFHDNAKVLRSWNPERGLSLKNFVGLVAERQVASIFRTGKRSPWTEDPTPSADMELLSENSYQSSVYAPGYKQGPEDRTASAQVLRLTLETMKRELSPLGLDIFQFMFVQEHSVKETCENFNMTADAVYAWRSRLARTAKKIVEKIKSENKNLSQKSKVGVN